MALGISSRAGYRAAILAARGGIRDRAYICTLLVVTVSLESEARFASG